MKTPKCNNCDITMVIHEHPVPSIKDMICKKLLLMYKCPKCGSINISVKKEII